MKTRNLTHSALFAALSVAMMYIGSALPTLSLTVAAATGMLGVIVKLRCGESYGWAMYTVASILALLFVPDRDISVTYLLLFGCYPLIKGRAEKPRSIVLRWAIKLMYFNAVVALLWFAGRVLFMEETVIAPWIIIASLVGLNGSFVIYDIAVGRMIGYYIYRFC